MEPATTGATFACLPSTIGARPRAWAPPSRRREDRVVNACGQVVGQSATASGTLHAFVWENGVMTDIGKLYGDGLSVASAINESGQIVGWGQALQQSGSHALLWTPRPK